MGTNSMMRYDATQMSYADGVKMNLTALLRRQVDILSPGRFQRLWSRVMGLRLIVGEVWAVGWGREMRSDVFNAVCLNITKSLNRQRPLFFPCAVQKAGAAQLASPYLLTQAKCNPPTALQAPSLGPCDARSLGPHAQKFSSLSLRRCRLG